MPAQGQVPSTRPPGYGAEYAAQQAAFDANSAARLKAEMEANADAFNTVVSNIKPIAEVSGGNLTPDRLLHMFAGAKDTPIFGGKYAQSADALRLAETMAKIGAANRSGRGGGSGTLSKSARTQPDEMWVRVTDKQGNTTVRAIKISDERAYRNARGEEGKTVVAVEDPGGEGILNVTNMPGTPGWRGYTGESPPPEDGGVVAPPPEDDTVGLSDNVRSNLAVARQENPDAHVVTDDQGNTAIRFPDGSQYIVE